VTTDKNIAEAVRQMFSAGGRGQQGGSSSSSAPPRSDMKIAEARSALLTAFRDVASKDSKDSLARGRDEGEGEGEHGKARLGADIVPERPAKTQTDGSAGPPQAQPSPVGQTCEMKAASSAKACSSEVLTQQEVVARRSAATTSSSFEELQKEVFPVKWILFKNKEKNFFRPILMQSANGPCPFLAICNVLLLRDSQLMRLLELEPPSASKTTAAAASPRTTNRVGARPVPSEKQQATQRPRPQRDEVSFQQLVQILANLALNRITRLKQASSPGSSAPASPTDENLHTNLHKNENSPDNEQQADASSMIWDGVFRILPKLCRGLDVNVHFEDVDCFEFTEELSVFDLFDIDLYHGWICPKSDPCYDAVVTRGKSYNQVVEKVFTLQDKIEAMQKKLAAGSCASSGTSGGGHVNREGHVGQEQVDHDAQEQDTEQENLVDSTEASLSEECLQLQRWLDKTAAQFTYAGLIRLHDKVVKDTLSVLLRNCHFSVIYMVEGQLYSLNTDEAFLLDQQNVWERITEVDGDTLYVDHCFRSRGEREAQRREEADRQLAMRLAEQEEAEAEAEAEQERRAAVEKRGGVGSRSNPNYPYPGPRGVLGSPRGGGPAGQLVPAQRPASPRAVDPRLRNYGQGSSSSSSTPRGGAVAPGRAAPGDNRGAGRGTTAPAGATGTSGKKSKNKKQDKCVVM